MSYIHVPVTFVEEVRAALQRCKGVERQYKDMIVNEQALFATLQELVHEKQVLTAQNDMTNQETKIDTDNFVFLLEESHAEISRLRVELQDTIFLSNLSQYQLRLAEQENETLRNELKSLKACVDVFKTPVCSPRVVRTPQAPKKRRMTLDIDNGAVTSKYYTSL
jgi:predicted nuclease with TOPRIM domain